MTQAAGRVVSDLGVGQIAVGQAGRFHLAHSGNGGMGLDNGRNILLFWCRPCRQDVNGYQASQERTHNPPGDMTLVNQLIQSGLQWLSKQITKKQI
jgi:hypothetical protein